MKQKQTKQRGRSMIEMLGVLAIIGILSITALIGFTYAMNKHRANETIYDVMLRGTNVPMVDENYASKPSGHEFHFPGLVNNGRQGTYYPMTTKKDAGSSYYVEATGVTYRVCDLILKMNPTDIDRIMVGDTAYVGDASICGTTDGLAMKFCFGSDGTICDGTGHGGSSGGSGSGSSGGTSGGSGSGSGTEPDACDGIVCQHDGGCVNGRCQCVDGYSGDYCEIEPECTADADCGGNKVCTDYSCGCPAGSSWNDVAQLCCGAPAQEDPSLCLTEYQEAFVGQCPGYVSACEDDQVCTDGVCCRASCPTTAGEVGYPHCASDTVTPVLGDSCLCTYTCPPPSGCTESEQECSKESDSFTGLTDFWCCDINATCGDSYGECKNACTSTQHQCSNDTDVWCCDVGMQCGDTKEECINSCPEGEKPYWNGSSIACCNKKRSEVDGMPGVYACCEEYQDAYYGSYYRPTSSGGAYQVLDGTKIYDGYSSLSTGTFCCSNNAKAEGVCCSAGEIVVKYRDDDNCYSSSMHIYSCGGQEYCNIKEPGSSWKSIEHLSDLYSEFDEYDCFETGPVDGVIFEIVDKSNPDSSCCCKGECTKCSLSKWKIEGRYVDG